MNAASEDERPEFSVIVPTLNEETEIGETLRRAAQALGPTCELLVVDGGSDDETVPVARGLARTFTTKRSRGGQLRTGAANASGDILVFLHADTWLEEGAGDAIRAIVAQGVGAGCLRFVLRTPTRTLRYRLLEHGVNWRTRVFGTATGDQAIFATRDAYDRAGGVADIPLFEDVTFVRSVRRTSGFSIADSSALTSPRRWEQGGFFRTLAIHWILRAAHASGFSPSTLDKLYRNRVRRVGA